MENRQEKIEIIVTLNDYLNKLIPGINDMVNHFYEGNESFALEKLKWCIRVLNITEDILDLNDEVETLGENFTSIVEALENEDYILVSDLFNYEVKELLENVKVKVEEVI